MVVGCQEYEFSAQPGEATTPLPAIEVAPPILEFSELRSDEYEVQTFTVTNVGDAGLYLNGITMENPDAFQVMNLDEPMGLEVGGSVDPSEAVQRFLQREPSNAAFLQTLGIDG